LSWGENTRSISARSGAIFSRGGESGHGPDSAKRGVPMFGGTGRGLESMEERLAECVEKAANNARWVRIGGERCARRNVTG